MTLCALFSEVRILGDAAITRKPFDHQNGERGAVAACDVRARGQYSHCLFCDKLLLCAKFHARIVKGIMRDFFER